jgi:hypothetical protein
VRAAAGVTVALTAAALAVAFGGTPASANETSPSPSASVSPPAAEPAEKKVESPTVPAEQPEFEQKQLAQVSGLVWDDENRNGIQDKDESPIADAIVLLEAQGDGELSQKAKLDALTRARSMQRGLVQNANGVRAAKTGADGRYLFVRLPNVPVRVWVAGPNPGADAVWRVSPKDKGTDQALDSDFAEVPVDLPGLPGGPVYLGKSDEYKLEADLKLALDAGLYLKKHAGSISGLVWNDRNRNGLQDAGEKGVKGLPVVAISEGRSTPKLSSSRTLGKLTAVADYHLTTTDAKGEYSFPEVAPDEWRVLVGAGPMSPDGKDIPVIVWTFTKKGVGTDTAKDSDVELDAKFQGKAAISDIVTVQRDGKVDIDAGVYRDEPTPSPSASASSEPPATASESPPAPGPGTGGGSLPKTGLAIGGFLLAGALLIGGGTALTLLARKRRTGA